MNNIKTVYANMEYVTSFGIKVFINLSSGKKTWFENDDKGE